MRASTLLSALCIFTPSLVSAAQIPLPLPLAPQQQDALKEILAHEDPFPESSNDHLLPIRTLHDLLTLHRDLIKIESISNNEYHVGWWLVSYLKEHGFNVEIQYVGEGKYDDEQECKGKRKLKGKKDKKKHKGKKHKGKDGDADEKANMRFNILAWPGENKFTKVLVSSHIDTVPPYIPYSFDGKHDEVSGRGSVDAKGTVAAQITAILSLLSNSSSSVSANDVSLLFVVGEETGGDGMRTFSSSFINPRNYSAVIFGEPTENKLVAGHKGNVAFDIQVTGKAAHSGYPWLGVSANNVLVEVLGTLVALEAGHVHGAELPWSDKYGNTTLNIGTISGGVANNVVAEKASASVVGRLAGGSPEDAKAAIQKALAPKIAAAEEAGGEVKLNFASRAYRPVDMSCDVEGFDCITVNYGTDIPFLYGPHKKYLYGPGSILVAHSDHEAIKVQDLERAVLDYEKLISAALEN